MKKYLLISALLILTSCSTHRYGARIAGGGIAPYDQRAQAVASDFAQRLKSKGFQVTQDHTNGTILLSFTNHSISGTANFTPDDTFFPTGYSYSYSARDAQYAWFSKRQLRQIPELFDEAQRESSNKASEDIGANAPNPQR
jgi:hypothetical protein